MTFITKSDYGGVEMKFSGITKYFCCLMKEPRAYLIFYLIIWLGFAIIYNYLSDDFYHSYIQREPVYIEQQEFFKENLACYLNNQIKNSNLSKFVIKNNAEAIIPFRIKEFIIYEINRTENGGLLVKASLILSLKENIIEQCELPYSVHTTFNIVNVGMFGMEHWIIKNLQVIEIFVDPRSFYKEQLDKLKFSVKSQHDMEHIIFSDKIETEIKEYVSTTFGQPKPSLDNFSRMLYLSAITITTTGYGDIVPLANRARSFVALEAISGIIIIGFFLNAVAQKIAKGDRN